MTAGLKAKTIKAVLRKRIDLWIQSLPESMRADARRDAIVTGGSIASMLLGEKVNDFDIYFRSKATTVAIAKHYVERFVEQRKARSGIEVPIFVEELQDIRNEPRVRIVVKSAGVEKAGDDQEYKYFEGRPPEEASDYVAEVMDSPEKVADAHEELSEAAHGAEPDPTFRPVFLSSNAVTLSNKVQIVIRFFGEPDGIHANYDFVHCTNYWEASTGQLTLRPEALESLLSRTLVYNGSRYPVASLLRVRKFVERGWRINAGQVLKMALQIGALDLTSFAVLEDQLTGVDAAYFNQMLDVLKDNSKEKLEAAYLVEIINRMFG